MKLASLLWTLPVAASTLLVGCSGSGPAVTGVTAVGPAAALAIVDQTDKRASAPGIAGVKITAEARPANGPARVIGSATTGADGKFTFRFTDNAPLKDQIWLTAEKEGFLPVREQLYLPGEGRVVVVVLPKSKK